MNKYHYYDCHTMNNYLSGSVVRKDGEPVYILRVGQKNGHINVEYFSLSCFYNSYYYGPSSNSPAVVCNSNLSAEGFNIKPIPLGFFNSNNEVVSLSYRVPSRQWKTGLTKNNTKFCEVYNPEGFNGLSRQSFDIPGFRNLLEGKFFSRKEVEESLRKCRHYKQLVLNRKWALDTYNNLIFHQLPSKPVGKWKDGYVLEEKYFYLQQELEIMLNET